MVHENDDRAHVPGRPQVPERDVEPLWPPEETDGVITAAPWAAATQPAPGPPPVAPAPAAPVTHVPTPPGAPGPVPAPRWAAGGPADAAAPPGVPAAATRSPASAAGPEPAAVTRSPASPGPAAVTRSPASAAGPEPTAVTHRPATAAGTGPAVVRAGRAGGDAPASGRAESPWAQPPQRTTPEAPAPAVSAGAPASSAPVEVGRSSAPSAETPTRLGPYPPAPDVPLPQPSYGDGAAYPPPAYPPSAYPPQPGHPGWYPPGWPPQTATPPQAGTPQTAPPQTGASHPADGPPSGPPVPLALPPGVYPELGWAPPQATPPTAEEFTRRRQVRPADPVATMGVRAVVNRIGLVRLAPGRHEQEMKRDIEMVRRNFGGLRQVTVVNPKGGAGKTVAILLLAMTFGQKRGGYVLAWDNNETQGTLGMRAQQDFHARTVRDMLRDLAQFQGPHGRVGDLSQYVRSQGEGMFDVLASDESATGGEMLTAAAFAEIREVVSRFYKLIFVDTGNNVRAQNWQAAMDATDQLVVTMSARNDSAETAARMLDHLEQSGRQRLVRQAVTVVSMPPSRKEIDLPTIQAHFAARTRSVLLAPYERLIDTGEPLRYGQLSAATRDAWLKIAASVAEGL
ncbi:MinD/ParA family ATP-binding protein [Micromonospora sp. NBS 11-29]|uniref:MinD/ParA family ATP-binding protein n=1 Tax=Micromonospora sp. NBS 11-29 TaxID=1960879 RepID=UPI000B7973FA|nr:chromosome partitioning protein [Micromonospora sp. NBS 11-29]